MHPHERSTQKEMIMDTNAEATALLAACKCAANTSWRLSRGGLVGRQAVASFRNFLPLHPGQAEVLLACQHFADTVAFGGLRGLWLIGPPGSGKTHLGSAIVSHVRGGGLNAHIYCCRAILRMLRLEFAPLSERGVVELLGIAKLLVLDNVGVGVFTDEESEQLLKIIELRYKHCLPTVLISNLDVGGIRTALGERSFDRLREGARVLACNWPSARSVNRTPSSTAAFGSKSRSKGDFDDD